MKKIAYLIALTVFLSAFLSGCYLLPKEEEALAPPLIKPSEVEYKTMEAQLSDISKETIVQGSFKSANEITLSFEEHGGYLIESNAKYGAKVHEGDLLFALDIGDMEIEQKVAELNLEKATMYYDRVKRRTSSTYDRRMAEIDMEIKQLAYDKITSDIEKSKIYAPFDGVVTYMTNAVVGDVVNAQKTMIKIADESQLRLMVQGDNASKFTFGETVYAELSAGKEKFTYEGKVVLSTREKPENMEESFEEPTSIIELSGFDTSKAEINQLVKITIVEQHAENIIAIRRNLIKNYFGRTFVYILEDGLKVERDVEVGITNTTMAEIRQGLEVGDLIILN